MPRLTPRLLALAALPALSACIVGAEPDLTPSIPEAAQGRWGMTANDCDPARDDNKGLMTVEATTVKFYESRATLAQVKERSDSRISATYDFTGEGMEWTRDMTFDVQDGGATLIRRDYGQDALPGPMKYMNCATL